MYYSCHFCFDVFNYTSAKQHYLKLTYFWFPKLDGCYPNKNEISQALGKSNGCIIVDILAVLKILIKVISLSHCTVV